jgi:hypothetical protein
VRQDLAGEEELLFNMLGAIAQFETEIRAERMWLLTPRRGSQRLQRFGPFDIKSAQRAQELANRCETHVQMVTSAARQGAKRVRAQRNLFLGFLRHTGLQL